MNPKRTDGGKPVTLTLAADVRALLPALAAHFSAQEQRDVKQREVMERALRALAKKHKLG